ncbi:orotidine-5'-phosphate decarboxylase [Patescibacteria group bacterium]|nr:orotidine-5'-phosphate decarboxylase [Patescibacteria group bacterium]
MNFADRLKEAALQKNSVVCVGLDPRLDQIPSFIVNKAVAEHGQTFTAVANAFLEFNKGIIDAVHDLVPCVKPQIAFYEEYGFQGIWAFEETCKYARGKGLLVIADAKRNDIGSTAEAYARAFIGKTDFFGEKLPVMDADAVTVTPYLGYDGIKPFVKVCKGEGKGVFVLVKTSNPSSGDLQDRVTRDEEIPVYELMGHFVESWGAEELGECGYSSVGAVVGATYPKELKRLREVMPNVIFLIPGYGAQGGGAEDVKDAFDEDGFGAIVVSARGVIFAYEKTGATKGGEDFGEAARDAVIKMNEDLNGVR